MQIEWTLPSSSRKYLQNSEDLGMACYTPPLKKAKKEGEMQLPWLNPIPSQNFKWDGIEAR